MYKKVGGRICLSSPRSAASVFKRLIRFKYYIVLKWESTCFIFKMSSPLAELLHSPSNCRFVSTMFIICFFKHSRDFCRFFPSHCEKPNNRTHFELGVHVHSNSIAPDYLTHTSPTRSPWNLVSVFQNSNSNIPTFFPLLGNIFALRIKRALLFERSL